MIHSIVPEMSDHHGEESVPKGNEWEVVALTDSTYAASPGPNEGISDSSTVGVENPETTHAMFMSGHFGSPIKQEPQPTVEHSGKFDSKTKEDLNVERVVSDGDEKFGGGSDFGDVICSSLIEEEHISSRDEATTVRSLRDDESLDRSDTSDISDAPKRYEEDEFRNLSYEPWWRKHAASLHSHAKNVNPMWSIVVAAAVVGLVIVGYRWQRGKQQFVQLKPRLPRDDESSRWILGPATRFKDANSSYVGVLSAAEH